MADNYYKQFGVLLKKAQSGDEEAFREIYRQTRDVQKYHLKQILKNNEEVADALQETYLLLYRNLDKIKPATVLLAYLNRLTFYVGKNFSRQNQRYTHRVSNFEWLEDMEEPDGDPQDEIDRQETFKVLKRAIEDLEERERQVIIMRYYQKMQHQEVAISLGISTTSAKRIQKAAQGHLRDLLKQQGVSGSRIILLQFALEGKRIKEQIKQNRLPGSGGNLLFSGGRMAAVLGVSAAGVAAAVSINHFQMKSVPYSGQDSRISREADITRSDAAEASGSGEVLSLRFLESEAGLDYNSIHCVSRSGRVVFPVSVDRDRHNVKFSLPKEDHILYYRDRDCRMKTLPVHYQGDEL